MFEKFLSSLLEAEKVSSTELEFINYELQDFHEVSANKDAIPLSNSLLAIRKLKVTGEILDITTISNRDFINLESRGKKIITKNLLEIKHISGNVYTAECCLPSVHNSEIRFSYNALNFLFDSVYTAHAECVQLK